jgi:arabinose-5-phosphate isomerase
MSKIRSVMKLNSEKIIARAKQVFELESLAIAELGKRVEQKFVKACRYLLSSRGKVIVIGMGKAGHIADKLAATFASTGTPAFFVHPGEAGHGDLGMITKEDAVLLLSNSGSTPEILSVLPGLKELQVPLIVISGNPKSVLAKEAWVNLDVSVSREACPLGLAPTSSTAAMLAMGDALAIALLEARSFSRKDFARVHPGGVLGKRLLLKVGDLMRLGKKIPVIKENDLLTRALIEMTRKNLGMTLVVNAQKKLLGIFTDGDLRRTLEKGLDVHTTTISKVMTKNCKTITLDILAAEALEIMEKNKITSLVVVKNQKPIGVIHLHDILQAGI